MKNNYRRIFLAVYILIALIIVLFSACQPTPSKEVVQRKNDGKFEDEVFNRNNTSEVKDVTSDLIWNESILNNEGNEFVEIKAEIVFPSASDSPVISIIPASFTQKQIDNFIECFSIDEKIYSNSEVLVQEEILSLIMSLELEHASFKNGEDGFDSELTDEYFEKQLSKYRSMLAEAPSKEDLKESHAALELNKDTGREELSVKIDAGKNELATILVSNRSQHNYNSTLTLMNGSRYTPDYTLYGNEANGIDLTMEQTKVIAENALLNLGLSDYYVKDIMTGRQLSDETKQGYTVICTPKFNNIPIIYSNMTNIKDPNLILDPGGSGLLIYADTGEVVEYVPRRYDECFIEMNIDDTGITYLIWSNIYEILSIENEKVNILDFEEIKQICIQQMENNFSYYNKENKIVYTIDRIELGLVNIPQRNKMGYFYLVPAWTFYGRSKAEDREPLEYLLGEYTIHSSLLTINAIDGSLIAN